MCRGISQLYNRVRAPTTYLGGMELLRNWLVILICFSYLLGLGSEPLESHSLESSLIYTSLGGQNQEVDHINFFSSFFLFFLRCFSPTLSFGKLKL